MFISSVHEEVEKSSDVLGVVVVVALAVGMAFVEVSIIIYAGIWLGTQIDRLRAREESAVQLLRSDTPCVETVLNTEYKKQQSCPKPTHRLVEVGPHTYLCRCPAPPEEPHGQAQE